MEPAAHFDDVLVAAREGDPPALGELWRRYAPSVVAFAQAKGSSEPEEITSEVFLGVFSGLRDFEGDEDAFRGFVYTVARRRIVDEHRRRSRRLQTVPWPSRHLDVPLPSAEEHAVRLIGDSWALELVTALAPDQADVLLLRIFGDLTVEQTAEVLGKRPGAVKALQRRALAALRRRLGEPPTTTSVRARPAVESRST